MGAGPGLVGLVAASLGAHVTLTDRCSAVLSALQQSTKAGVAPYAFPFWEGLNRL